LGGSGESILGVFSGVSKFWPKRKIAARAMGFIFVAFFINFAYTSSPVIRAGFKKGAGKF
jgi:hypothetical protein